MVTKMRATLIFIFIVIVACHSVSVDYYIGNKQSHEDYKSHVIYKNNNSNLLQTSKIGDGNKEPNISIENTNTTPEIEDSKQDYEEYDELTDIEEQMSQKTLKIKISTDQNVLDSDPEQIEIGHDPAVLRLGNDPEPGLDTKINKTMNDIFEEYGQQSDSEESGTAHPVLRDQDKTTENQLNTESDAILIKNATEEESDTEKLPIDFYNLIPASSVLNDTDSKFRTFNIHENVWYVPENCPCWELPILYAESGQIMSNTDVFLMYQGILKNVEEKLEKSKTPSKPLYVPVSQNMNKWCAVGPCYGDHTLCLFPERINSKLCRNGYVVSTPTMIEQIGLVNTVNSMRNRVANGETGQYKHLPKAADMNQIIYDLDLESMAVNWLHQCLPGPAACSALDENYVTQLECTKHARHCCIDSFKSEMASKCIPQYECYVDAIIGCIHLWFSKAGSALTTTDVQCGHITPATYHTAQLLWAETNKIGCAYGKKIDGDVRVVCNFAPGAPYFIDTKYYCGFISHPRVKEDFAKEGINLTSPNFLAALGISLNPVVKCDYKRQEFTSHQTNYSLRFSNIDILGKIYKRKWIRSKYNETVNDTIGLVARLVTKYSFVGDDSSQCDSGVAIYESGEPGSKCVERGRRFHALCYDFRDPTPGYRLVAVVAPIALFSLILYDLFSGVVRQTNY
ncbi:uncharacterized protein LOC111360335 [Spodoptera litura]|uniref:Uncharacterized protein LOC111360335 n=1 Tax=Spodoptera litura TaxID=69820 RepID=A0A9J7J0D8_SPOLT|nr:uncharacterized protein LOC111360335 [Spodoptera litura]